jgi:hypothetical protein
LLLLVLAPSSALGGPWTKNAGELYLKLSESLFFSDTVVDASGGRHPAPDYVGATTSIYLELGLWRGLHFQAYLPFTVARNGFAEGESLVNAGGGDALFGLQYSPPLGLPFPNALRLEVKLPFYNAGLVDTTDFPALGDGQIDLTFWLSAGGSFASRLHLFSEVGYRHRTEAFIGDGPFQALSYGDGIALYAQGGGYAIVERLRVLVNFGGVVALTDDKLTQSSLSLGPALHLSLWRGLAIEATFDPVVFARNSASGFGLSLGLSYKR